MVPTPVPLSQALSLRAQKQAAAAYPTILGSAPPIPPGASSATDSPAPMSLPTGDEPMPFFLPEGAKVSVKGKGRGNGASSAPKVGGRKSGASATPSVQASAAAAMAVAAAQAKETASPRGGSSEAKEKLKGGDGSGAAPMPKMYVTSLVIKSFVSIFLNQMSHMLMILFSSFHILVFFFPCSSRFPLLHLCFCLCSSSDQSIAGVRTPCRHRV